MALVNFSSLDFTDIKDSIKSYLRSNSNFTDYDFEGSNFSVLIDTLAYNTYISSFNANMVANEVFLDSATLRENIISLARNIGYTPRSKKSARMTISFDVNTLGTPTISPPPLTITLKEGIVAYSSRNGGNVASTFVILNDITRPVDLNGMVSFEKIDVYEGTLINQSFVVDTTIPNQRFILDNPGIDTSLLKVSVVNQNSVEVKYKLADSLFEVESDSRVYFIQEIEDEKYELIFGDDKFGKKLLNGETIIVSYVITNGEDGNGVRSISFNGRFTHTNGNIISRSPVNLVVDQYSYGGSEIESVESVRKYAPKIYSSQYRAVTAADYEAVLPQIFPELDSVSAFGGEELNPPQYGKVFLSIKPNNGDYLSLPIKQNIKRDLKKYSVAGIEPVIVDLKYLYVEPSTNAYYNTNLAKSQEYLSNLIMGNVVNYSKSPELNKFGARFKYSKFLKIVDDSHPAITSNITNIIMRRDMRPEIGSYADYEVCFGNRFHIKDKTGFNIKSSGFTVDGLPDILYISDIPNTDLRRGRLFLFKLVGNRPQIVRNNIGIVDYIKGEVLINAINITSTVVEKGENLVEISISPYSNDVIGLQDLYLVLDINMFKLGIITDQIESGIDTSGTTYIVSPSYSNGIYTR